MHVEGRARRHLRVRIDQADLVNAIASGELVGERTAEDACAENGDRSTSTFSFVHPGGILFSMTVGPQLAGQVAVVTGGSRGIGLATASALMTHGVDVTICGRSEESLRAARLQIERVPGSASG